MRTLEQRIPGGRVELEVDCRFQFLDLAECLALYRREIPDFEEDIEKDIQEDIREDIYFIENQLTIRWSDGVRTRGPSVVDLDQ